MTTFVDDSELDNVCLEQPLDELLVEMDILSAGMDPDAHLGTEEDAIRGRKWLEEQEAKEKNKMTDQKKTRIRVVLDLDFDPNEEHTYALITRIEGNIHRHVQLGMFGSDHPSDAALVDFKADLNEVVS